MLILICNNYLIPQNSCFSMKSDDEDSTNLSSNCVASSCYEAAHTVLGSSPDLSFDKVKQHQMLKLYLTGAVKGQGPHEGMLIPHLKKCQKNQ